MRKRLFYLVFMLLGATMSAEEFKISANSVALVTIIVSPNASEMERFAANELRLILDEVTGAEFNVIDYNNKITDHFIALGTETEITELVPNIDISRLSPEGVAIVFFDNGIVLSGGQGRGVLYSVYTFLEDLVGCHWWTSEVSFIPKEPSLVVSAHNILFTPPFQYRDVYWKDSQNPSFAVRNKCNGVGIKVDTSRGGKTQYLNGFAHTFNDLVPVAKYYKDHPEWFSEINGRRIGANGEVSQLCLSNEELQKFVIEEVMQIAEKHPEGGIISISQNDNSLRCQCDKCKEIEAEEGSPSGPIIRFVNAIASAVHNKYPNIQIDTLAYQYSQKPPLLAKPLDNVIVRLCNFESNLAEPVYSNDNQDFEEDLKDWASICANLYIWDYVTNFDNYLEPYPNLTSMSENLKYYAKLGIKGVFEEGAYNSNYADFSALKAWLEAKLLWNPDQDSDTLIRQFLKGYYGDGYRYIYEYLNSLSSLCQQNNTLLRLYMPLTVDYLRSDRLMHYWDLLNRAEEAIMEKSPYYDRIEELKLSLQYVLLNRWYEYKNVTLPWKTYSECRDDFIHKADEYSFDRISESMDIHTYIKNILTIGNPGISLPTNDNYSSSTRVFCCNLFRLALFGRKTSYVQDSLSTNNIAVELIGDNHEWLVQLPLRGMDWNETGHYKVQARVRLIGGSDSDPVFSMGIYDERLKRTIVEKKMSKVGTDMEYHMYELGPVQLNQNRYIWIAPQDSDSRGEIYIDYIAIVQND